MSTPKNRTVLGVNAFSHDAAAALIVDGRLVFAASEERYDRVRHSRAFPRGAVRAALQHAGLSPGDVDAVAFPWLRDMARLRRALYFLLRFPRSLPFLLQRPDGLPARLGHLRQVAGLQHEIEGCGITAPITYVDHHRAHAQQAFVFGPSDAAAVLTADGMGEWASASTWRGRAERLTPLARRNYPHSLGKVYAAVTQHLGFLPESDEGKTMGLAPYGREALLERFRSVLAPSRRRLFRVRTAAFDYPLGHTALGGARFARLFGAAREPESAIAPAHEDLAFAAQAVLEEVVLSICGDLRASTGLKHLGLAGGIFLNCALNGRLLRESGFDSVWAFPAAGDGGAAVGAAAQVAGMPRTPLEHVFLGDAFGQAEIDRALGDRPRRLVSSPAGYAAEALARGRFVGWFQGRMEFGPRALGARSILADPRSPEVRDRLNRDVKFRERFRPFAPAVLLEAAGDWFVNARPSPHMMFTFQARPRSRDQIPDVVHVAGSARVQTVGPGDGNPAFRRLLEAFARSTGVPVLLNTSLNVRGEPIVRTPEQALALFDKSGLDVLVLEDRVIEKKSLDEP